MIVVVLRVIHIHAVSLSYKQGLTAVQVSRLIGLELVVVSGHVEHMN